MEPTIRLFDEDSETVQFEAVVLSCEEDGEYYRVVLNQTAFFPEGGGQGSDIGTLGDIAVEKVIEEDQVIYHLTREAIWEGETVSGLVDWKNRFETMQQHTGEHIVSGIVHDRFGYNNVGFHLSHDYTTMDYDGPLNQQQIDKIEQLANEAVAKDIPVKAWYPSPEELEEIDYRSKKEIEGAVRIVKIPGYDICACCAPHVKRTGQIGLIRIKSWMHYKGGVRLTLLCGFRALADYRALSGAVGRICTLLSAKQENAAEAVERIYQEGLQSRQENGLLKQEILHHAAAALPAGDNVCFFHPYLDGKNMHRIFNELIEDHAGLCGCFAGSDEEGYRYVLGSKTADARKAGAAMNEVLHGNGGGSAQMVQGKLACTRQEIEDYFGKL